MDIFNIIRNNDFNALQEYINSGQPIDLTEPANSNGTLLHIAVQSGHLECVRLLLTTGARRDILDYCGHGYLPIHSAVEGGYVEILKELIADKDAQSSDRSTALHIACKYGDLDCLRVLLEADANVTIKDCHGRTPLHYSIMSSKLELVKCLVEANADPHNEDKLFATPYKSAHRGHFKEIVEYFDSAELPTIKEPETEILSYKMAQCSDPNHTKL